MQNIQKRSNAILCAVEFACSIPFKYITSRSQRKLQIEPWIGPNGGREKKLHWTFQLILIAFTCDILTSPSKRNRLYSCGNEDNYSLCSCPGCFLPRNKKQPRCIWFTPDKPTNCVRRVWLTCETVSRDNIYNTVTSAGLPLQRNNTFSYLFSSPPGDHYTLPLLQEMCSAHTNIASIPSFNFKTERTFKLKLDGNVTPVPPSWNKPHMSQA